MDTTLRIAFEGPQGGLFSEAPPGEDRAQAVDQVLREASSLKLLREKVSNFPQESSQGVSVWQPHTKVKTQKREKRRVSPRLSLGLSLSRLPLLFHLMGFLFSAP